MDSEEVSMQAEVILTSATVGRDLGKQVTMTRKETISAYFTIAAAAFGLISDGYQNNLMTMSNVVFKRLYPKDYTSSVSTRVSNALLVGAIIGQLFVGLVCDRMGRKVALVFTTLLIVLGATLGTAAHGAHGSAKGLFWFLTFARGLTGIGVGGEYPASSTSASEAANEQMPSKRGPVFIMVTNFVLSFGGPLACSVFLIVLSIAGEDHLNTVWRVCFGVGIVLPLTVLVFRLRMLSSKLYRKGAIKKRVPYGLVFKRYWRPLIGTCGAWFLYDFVTFPNGVFSGTIISSVIHNNDIKKTAEWQLLLSSIALPGVFIGALLCNPLGRRNTMILGFSGYLIFGLTIGLAYERITKIIPLFVVFYGLMQSSGNLGPGDMLGLVSAESYATPIRGTCYGLSAAVGKAGAAIGTQAFTPIQNNLGKRWTFIIAAICGVTGILVTYFFVPDMTGVDLAEEDARFMEYLESNGWEGVVGEDEDMTLIEGAGPGPVISNHNGARRQVVIELCVVKPVRATNRDSMPFSSLPRVVLPTSSWASHRWIRSIRFASTSSNLSAFDKRVDCGTVHDASKPQCFQSKNEHGIDIAGPASDPSKTESYLLSLLKDGATPTLHDLERLKPPQHSDPRSTKYAHEYRTLVDNICRSFSSDQLRGFTQNYGLQLGLKRRKTAFAEAIVEKAWQWPSLRELRRAQRDRTEVTSRTVPLTSSELFVLLGKDGSDFSELSKKYNIHISVKPNPLAIYLEGSRESVREAERHVDGVKKGIIEDTIDTPFTQPVSQEILQRISRLSGAFVENAGNQKLRVRARHSTNIMLAQRLSFRHHYQREPSELLVQQTHSQELHTPTTAPLAYALYPFSIPRSSPMMMGSSTFFRWRRIGDWLGDPYSESQSVSGLANSQNNISTVDGTEVFLQHRLVTNTSLPSHGPKRLVSASSGHILFPSPRQSVLLASHAGGLTYSDTRSWVSTERSSATFIPSLPLDLIKVLPSQQKVLHRLVYRSLPVLGQSSNDPVATHFIRLEVPLVDPKQVQSSVGFPDGSVLAGAIFWSGSSANLDIVMPDRRMDLRFNVSDVNTLGSNQYPSELLAYLNDLENFLISSDLGVVQPVPPLRVLHDDREYFLVTNASVRQSTESLSSDPSPEIAVTSESTLDLESGHHSAVCVVSTDRLDSPREWDAFLQKCDQMTARTSPRSSVHS